MKMVFNILIFQVALLLAAETPEAENTAGKFKGRSLGRIGDYGYPDNPQLDRAKGYLLKGKINNAVSNYGNFISWDFHPAGLWNNFAYLPHVGFVAGVPGHVYSSKWSSVSYKSWVKETVQIGTETVDLWTSKDAFNAWMEDVEISDSGEFTGNFLTVVYNTIDDRGDIGTRRSAIDEIDLDGELQWILDRVEEKLILYIRDISLDPNYPESLIGLAYPWSIRPGLKERTDEFDKYDYGEDLEEWTEDDNYEYYGATFAESWFTRDNGARLTDWQASTKSRFNTHNLVRTAGEMFGSTQFTDNADPDALLAHSALTATWPERYNVETGEFEKFWPGGWADEYYGENPGVWAEKGITDCQKDRLDDDCWKPLPGRHISDMDVYMEFDDRWAHLGNRVVDNEYEATGYPMGLKVMSMAHSYGISYAEDVMFVTVNIRNESGDFCAYKKDKNGTAFPVIDSQGNVVCEEGLIMPDGTKLNRGKGFDYKDLYLGFYMDADVLSTDAAGNFNVHTNSDDFMRYIDCLISKDEYPDGCPEIQGNQLRISMAIIGDWDGESNAATGYSMRDGENKGPDFGVVAVQLLDSPYATDPVDLDQDGFNDIFPGERLKMTDWHWFDWYNRPGVVSRESNSNCCAGAPGRAQARNKELIQYKVIAGDNTNLSDFEKTAFFHTADPEADLDSELNPHFDSLDGLEQTVFFREGEEGLDCVLEMSTGPFDLEVGETVSFSFSIIYGQNIEDLKQNAKFAQIMYNSHYQGYTAPLTPELMALSKHNKVELYWDDLSESSKDVITGYTDFEGYKIYKSKDGGETWGLPEDEIVIENVSVGWQPYVQFDLSKEADSLFNVTSDTTRGASVSGQDPLAPWFSLGTDTGLDNLLLDSKCWVCSGLDQSACGNAPQCSWDETAGCVEGPGDVSGIIAACNADSALVCDEYKNCCGISHKDFADSLSVDNSPQCFVDGEPLHSGDTKTYRYKFVDENVFDGIKYTYSLVAYDIGVMPRVTTYVDTLDANGNVIGQVPSIISIPDPENWGLENSFQTLESPRGTTIQDKNFTTIIPGYTPEEYLTNVKVVPNPYIVQSDFNETNYKKSIRFTRLPEKCTITIFTVTGEKVQELKHDNATDGNEIWDLRSYNNQEIAPGLYLYTVETPNGEKMVDKFAVVR